MASVEQDTLRQRKATDTAPQEVPTAPAPGNSAPVKKDVFGSQGPQGWKRRHQGLLQDQLGRYAAVSFYSIDMPEECHQQSVRLALPDPS